MRTRLRESWKRLNDLTVGTEAYWEIALQNVSFYRDMRGVMKRHIRGRTLDVGAGKLAWRREIERFCTSYLSADHVKEHPDIDLLFDITDPFPFVDGSFDTVYCCSVLEHTPEPWKALPEVSRILRRGGIAIVSVPFLYYLHGEPHDYFRFTEHACRQLASEAGFEIEELTINGGLFEFLANALSMTLSALWFATGMGRCIPATTFPMYRMARALDRWFGSGRSFAMNHIMVLRRP